MAKWDEMEEWDSEAQSEIVSRVIADFNSGAFGKEFSTKLVERSLSERDVELAIVSRRSLIGRYSHLGQERIGFWQPNTGVFVAWKPTLPTRIVSAFERHDGENYFRNLDAEPIRR
ncbi:hypothetical protein IH992_24405 [Candidatus Poribacteria bacterium]|nr:hypothetical protein [Candidatus Poribacteria bacterium]